MRGSPRRSVLGARGGTIETVNPLAAVDSTTVALPVIVLLFAYPYWARSRSLESTRRPVPRWRQWCYYSGLVVLAVALSPPIDSLSDQLLVAHMTEHLMIGDLAALLIVLGMTGPVLGPLLRVRGIQWLRVLGHPVVAIIVWAVNFYAWHIPAAYQGALRHPALHAVEHASFLAFGIAVWMALLGPLPKPGWFTNAWRLVYIIFGGSAWYPFYRASEARWHISPIADQVAAGGVMMVEESLLTIGLFCWLFLKVAREQEERQALLDYAVEHGVALDEARAARAVAAGRGDELWERLRAG
jgi:putative membrane protein